MCVLIIITIRTQENEMVLEVPIEPFNLTILTQLERNQDVTLKGTEEG